MTPSATFLWLYYLIFAGIGLDPAGSACSSLSSKLPGKVNSAGSTEYEKANKHWAGSSSQASKCTVEPATSADIVTILKVIEETSTPWAVKGGGHAYNPGYSSTSGVLISLTKFNDVTYNAAVSTAHIGAGVVSGDVYAKLCPLGVNVVGGRLHSVGMAGFTLGGGYGWSTQQYGLAIDTVTAFDLVTPTGSILTVTEKSNSNLFFGLRGGGNNFGIVTGFTLETHNQTEVYGGVVMSTLHLSAVTDAIVDFDANNRDPKAAILASYTLTGIAPTLLQVVVFLFYDGPEAPPETFKKFLDIHSTFRNVKRRTFPNFIKSLEFVPFHPRRVAIHTVPIIQHTKPIIEEVIAQTRALGKEVVTPGKGFLATLSVEPFIRNLYDHSKGGAYPHSSKHPWTPFQVLVEYGSASNDAAFRASVKKSADAIHQVAIQQQQSSPDAILYNNYAMAGTPLELLYGDNLPKLSQLREQYDPHNLVNLTGGWHF